MTATVLLCVIFTTTFCLCTRGVLALSSVQPRQFNITGQNSQRAKRVARGYLIFAMTILSVGAFLGAAVSYFDLFTQL